MKPCCWHSSSTGILTSGCFRNSITCSSVNRFSTSVLPLEMNFTKFRLGFFSGGPSCLPRRVNARGAPLSIATISPGNAHIKRLKLRPSPCFSRRDLLRSCVSVKCFSSNAISGDVSSLLRLPPRAATDHPKQKAYTPSTCTIVPCAVATSFSDSAFCA